MREAVIADCNIVCFAPSDWWGMNPSCTTHIMRGLSAKNRILYINPFSSDLLGGCSKKGWSQRITRKLKSLCKWLRRPEKNLFVLSPLFLPLQGTPWLDGLNNAILKLQIRLVCKVLHMSRPILWVENLRSADMLHWFHPCLTVYHVSDLFEQCTYTRNRQILQQREETIRRVSDVLICVSRQLYVAKRAQAAHVFYLPHGVDFDLFRRAAGDGDRILSRFGTIPHPIAGYFGTMTALNDIELLEYCADALPNVSFVLVGQITGGAYGGLSKRPNVHLLGRMPYEQIPSLCASFDVCMLHWKMSDWINHCSPLKFFEYMSSGKPIVSVPIPEIVEHYLDLVSIAHSKEEFAKALVWELTNDSPERVQRRIAAAGQHSWTNHVEQLSAIIVDALREKHGLIEQEHHAV
jgi:glycosyltransferase involved in cell wall biosynthesis